MGETCDDGNTSACGTCSADCRTAIAAAAATGTIIVAAATGTNIMDRDTFTLSDGFKMDRFEFDTGNSVDPGNIRIPFTVGYDILTIENVIEEAILTQGTTAFTVSNGGNATIVLTNRRATSLGNQPFNPTGGIATSFTFIGMSGGQGGNCDTGVGCVTGDDCTSGVCNSMGHCN